MGIVIPQSSYDASSGMVALSPREVAWRLGHPRRDFLREAAGMALGATLMGAKSLCAWQRLLQRNGKSSS